MAFSTSRKSRKIEYTSWKSINSANKVVSRSHFVGGLKREESNPKNKSAVILRMLESVEVVMIFENAGKSL